MMLHTLEKRSRKVKEAKPTRRSKSKSPKGSKCPDTKVKAEFSQNTIRRSKSRSPMRSKTPDTKVKAEFSQNTIRRSKSKSPMWSKSSDTKVKAEFSQNTIRRSKSKSPMWSKSSDTKTKAECSQNTIRRSKSKSPMRSKGPDTKAKAECSQNKSKSPRGRKSKSPKGRKIPDTKAKAEFSQNTIRRSKSKSPMRSKGPDTKAKAECSQNKSKSPRGGKSKSPKGRKIPDTKAKAEFSQNTIRRSKSKSPMRSKSSDTKAKAECSQNTIRRSKSKSPRGRKSKSPKGRKIPDTKAKVKAEFSQNNGPSMLECCVNLSPMLNVDSKRACLLPLPQIMPSPKEFFLPDIDYLSLKLQLRSDDYDSTRSDDCVSTRSDDCVSTRSDDRVSTRSDYFDSSRSDYYDSTRSEDCDSTSSSYTVESVSSASKSNQNTDDETDLSDCAREGYIFPGVVKGGSVEPTLFNTKVKETDMEAKFFEYSGHLNTNEDPDDSLALPANFEHHPISMSANFEDDPLSLPATFKEDPLLLPHTSRDGVMSESSAMMDSSDNSTRNDETEGRIAALKCDPIIFGVDGVKVVEAYCINDILLIVLAKKVKFWKLEVKSNNLEQGEWILIGSVAHKRVCGANFLGERASEITLTEKGVLYCELWKSELVSVDERNTRLIASMYYYNVRKNQVTYSILELDTIEGLIVDMNFYILNDRSVFMCYLSTDKPTGFAGNYYGRVRKYSLNSTLTNVAKPKKFNFTVGSVLYLHCTYGSPHVLGHTNHMLYLWNHHDPNHFNSVTMENFKENEWIHWSKEKEGFLFLLVGKKKSLEYIAQHLRSSKTEVLHVYNFPPEFHGILGAHLDGNIVAAVFRNGIVNWEFSSSELLSMMQMDRRRSLFLSEKYVISVNLNAIETYPLFLF